MHDEKYRNQYKSSPKFERLGYEEDFLTFLLRMQTDMDRKIKRNKERLDLTQPGGQVKGQIPGMCRSPQGKVIRAP